MVYLYYISCLRHIILVGNPWIMYWRQSTEQWGLFVGCLTSQQHASVSQAWICPDNFTCCHTEIEVAVQTFYVTQSQYTDTRPTSPSADPITPGAWQGSHWSANFLVTGMTRPRKILSQAGFELWTGCFRGGHLNHLANEAVRRLRQIWNCTFQCHYYYYYYYHYYYHNYH